MIAIAHFAAITLYLAAAALAATPLARPMNAPYRGVVGVLAAGVAVHAASLAMFARAGGHVIISGLGPSLSLAGLLLALTLVVVELIAREVSLTLVAAPLAALPTIFANIVGFTPAREPSGVQGAWLAAHIALSFIGIAAFGTAAAAGLVYLVERRQLKTRRFGALFRLFPPLATLDRVNHVAAVAGWLALTFGVVLAVSYAFEYHQMQVAQLAWGVAAWVGVSTVALGRVTRGWQARRAAILSSVSFAAVVLLYVALRVAGPVVGRFH
ncbi:MAG TPA: cytochrome c biogenesis protein CcsA [Gemmatimonadaceae bacterium]|jgi:ABC-type uncharacterized transport system permease subunit|nr:cytochrome c biogenesis protein CcsA [Gemmatimonadaceae bacterium]